LDKEEALRKRNEKPPPKEVTSKDIIKDTIKFLKKNDKDRNYHPFKTNARSV
jgi:hypothetical protein